MSIETLDDLDIQGTTVGVRVDINSPLTDSVELADDARLHAHTGTLTELLEGGAKVAIIGHQGRPGGDDFSDLRPHAERLDELLSFPVGYSDATFSRDARERIDALDEGEAVVLENARFYSEEYMEFPPERAAETHLVTRLAPVLDAYVNDAFAAAHRSQPSLVGFPSHLPSYAGRVMEQELAVLGNIDETPTPRVYIVGGAKVPDSVAVIESVLERDLADTVLTTGVVANVFLFADGVDLGDASAEFIHNQGYWDEIDHAADLLAEYGDRIRMPTDVAVERDGERHELALPDLPPESDEAAMDIGTDTVAAYAEVLRDAGTAILNGPAGVFENDLFAKGSQELYSAVTQAEYSIVGGGDTSAAIHKLGIEGFDHVSTGGGAALSMLTGDPLPAVEALRKD